jgi:aspartate/methionine/tyrosine aminotransferase
VKAPLRPFEYMAWAKTVPRGARYDLTASGVADTLADGGNGIAPESWVDDLDVADLCRRDRADAAADGLIAAVAQRYDVDAAHVTPTLAASTAIMHVLMALVRTGDHVVVERPTYEALRRTPEILGARVSRLERKFEEDWAVVPDRLAQLLTSRTRAVILSNLHNPSGVAIDAKTMHAICELASRVGAMVLVDEVYLDYCFSNDPAAAQLPACRVAKNAVSWSSTTKCMGFSALRAGWIVTTDPDAAKAIRAATDYLHVYPPVATARLATRVLAHADELAQRAHAISVAGRRVVERWLSADNRVSWVPPTAGLTGVIKLPAFMQDTVLCEHLRQRYETQIVPGSMFEAPGFCRMSFGVPTDHLEQALANITAALDDLV